MTAKIVAVTTGITCDHEGCTAGYEFTETTEVVIATASPDLARQAAHADGWVIRRTTTTNTIERILQGRNFDDLCPGHAPLPDDSSPPL